MIHYTGFELWIKIKIMELKPDDDGVSLIVCFSLKNTRLYIFILSEYKFIKQKCRIESSESIHESILCVLLHSS